MKKKDLDQWIAALRSGECEQGFGYLCSSGRDGEHRYCCLGVMIEELYDGEWEMMDDGTWAMEHDRILPGEKVLESVGLDFRTSDKLSTINDSGRTFLHIAAWLEKNRERLELCDGSDLGGH